MNSCEMAIIPYEHLMNVTTPIEPMNEAIRILERGWNDRSYGVIHLDGRIPWRLNSHDERSWNYRIHSWHMLESLLRAHSISGDQHFLIPAITVVFDWISEHHGKPPDAISPFAWFGMAVGMRAYRLAYILDAGLQSGLLSKKQKEVFFSSLLAHQDYLANDSNILFHNNHGFIQVAGQLAMGRRFASASPSMGASFKQGQQRLRIMLQKQFDEDGAHLEHSPNYHRMVCESLKSLIDAGLVVDPEMLELVLKIERSLSWFMTPGGQIANFGDTDYESLFCSPSAAKQRWITPEMQFQVSGGSIGKSSPETMAIFPHAGYCIFRIPTAGATNDLSKVSYLAQLAAFHSRSHKHADDLTFIWSDRGNDILVDSGRYGYIGRTEVDSDLWMDGHWYSDPYRIYCESTRAHNTLEFDGRNYKRKGVKPYGSALTRWSKRTDGIYFVESSCRHFNSIRRVRVLIFNPGKWLIALDWFRDNAAHTHSVRQWFHLAPSLHLTASAESYVASVENSREPLRVISLIGATSQSPIYRGIFGTDGEIQGWFSPEERVIFPNDAFCFELSGQSHGAFATLLSFSNELQADTAWSSINSTCRNARLRWSDELGLHTLTLDRGDKKKLILTYLVTPPVSPAPTFS
jgi:hypothetical protein